jgi:long-subunit acyl-CoA synthetase (AMP-forming)
MSHIIVADEEWTTENDLLTPTLKVKRDVLEAKYTALISQPFTSQVAWEAP